MDKKIQASLLAADIFNYKPWMEKFAGYVDAFHIDFVDPSFAGFIGVDFRVISKMHELGYKFVVHYMACWNDELIEKIASYKPAAMFFHQKHIKNYELFHKLKTTTKIGIALELNETPESAAMADINDFILMNVPLGYCGQKFNDANIPLSHELKKQGKTIISDGGINLDNIKVVKHFDYLVMGNALNTTDISALHKALMDAE